MQNFFYSPICLQITIANDSPSSDMPSSNTPADDIELSPGAANENDERFIWGELKTKKKYFLAKETFAKTFLISFWFNSVIWCQYKKIFQYCSSCSFLYLLGNPEKALYCNITILQVSNKSFHWTNLIEQHVEDYWYKFMARQSFNSSFTLFVQKSRSIV